MPHEFSTSYIADSLALFRQYKQWADRAMGQLSDEQLYQQIDPEANSIAILVKHLAGNMRSRFTEFLTTDGEKPDRNRDGEFVDPPAARADLLAYWESGWKILFATLESLTDADLTSTVAIRSEPHSVMQAINRQVGHYCLHVGQIILLAKHYQGEQWKTLTIPKNASSDFHRRVLAREASQR